MKQLFILTVLTLLPLASAATIKISVQSPGMLQLQYENLRKKEKLEKDHSLVIEGTLNGSDILFLHSKMREDSTEWIEELDMQRTNIQMAFTSDFRTYAGEIKDEHRYEGLFKLNGYKLYSYLYYHEGRFYNSDKTLYSYMFYDCQTLRRLILPCTMRGIGIFCVSFCDNLEELVIADSTPNDDLSNYCLGAQELRPMSIHGCPKLQQVILPYFLKTIHFKAFSECDALERVVIKNAVCPPAYGYNCFPHPEKLELIVLTDSRSSQFEESPYLSAPGWKDFGSITTMTQEEYIATTVSSVRSQAQPQQDIHDLHGHRLTGKPSKGVYIEDGRKMVGK